MDTTSNEILSPSPAPQALLPVPALIVPPAPEAAVTTIPTVLGKLDTLSEVELLKYQACQAVMALGWQSFLEVGQALAQIRDERLYRAEFDSFEEYCRCKWEYGRRQVDRLISAAQVITRLSPNWSHCLPCNEAQLRPLVGLTPEQTQLAWERVTEKAGGRRISARLVRSALKDLNLTSNPKPVPCQTRPSKVEQRRLIDQAIGELLILVSQNARRDVLTEKLEALHRHIQSVFAAKRYGS